ncbi:MAG: class I SAM-dependent methyltransferase [Terriglobales bacterium]
MKVKTAKPCGDEHVLKGREPLQLGWYDFASGLVEGRTVLDVGCGSGEGLKWLQRKAKKALGIDLDPRLAGESIRICNLGDMESKSFDVVVCIDVLEHIEGDRAFAAELVRVARNAVFVSTPNYAVNKNRHPYHVREYVPDELVKMFVPFGRVTLFGGDSTGHTRRPIRNRPIYYFINRLYTWKPTVLLAKILKRLLLTKVWAHQAVWVELPTSSEAVCDSTVSLNQGSERLTPARGRPFFETVARLWRHGSVRRNRSYLINARGA